jgi:NAD(P)-dependent dehydrogenase (short-subunit alcohol dehydrogenase family)
VCVLQGNVEADSMTVVDVRVPPGTTLACGMNTISAVDNNGAAQVYNSDTELRRVIATCTVSVSGTGAHNIEAAQMPNGVTATFSPTAAERRVRHSYVIPPCFVKAILQTIAAIHFTHSCGTAELELIGASEIVAHRPRIKNFWEKATSYHVRMWECSGDPSYNAAVCDEAGLELMFVRGLRVGRCGDELPARGELAAVYGHAWIATPSLSAHTTVSAVRDLIVLGNDALVSRLTRLGDGAAVLHTANCDFAIHTDFSAVPAAEAVIMCLPSCKVESVQVLVANVLSCLEVVLRSAKQVVVVFEETRDLHDADFSEIVEGLLLCAQREYPTVSMTAIRIAAVYAHPLHTILQCELDEAESEVRYDGEGVRSVKRYSPVQCSPATAQPAQNSSYIVTGGLGGLGLQTAKVLAQQGAKHIFLVSRSGKVSHEGQGLEEDLRWLQEESGAVVHILQCDVSDETAVMAMLQTVRTTADAINGIVHCAGVLRDGLIRGGKAASGSAEVLSSKALSAWYLHKHTLSDQLEVFVCLSSITSALGNAGQSSYGAANRFLDVLVEHRRRAGLCGVSLRLPAVAGVGMAADLLSSNVKDTDRDAWSVTAQRFAEIVTGVLRTECEPVLTVVPTGYIAGLPGAIAVHLPSIHCQVTDRATPSATASIQAAPKSKGRTAAEVADTVRGHIHALLNSAEAVADDTPLLDMGFDSLSTSDLVQRLSRELEITLPATLVYDHPTTANIVAYVQVVVEASTASVTQVQIASERTVDPQYPIFASYFPTNRAAATSRVVVFPAMGQPTMAWHDIAMRFKRSNVEVHVVRMPGVYRAAVFHFH